MTDRRFNEDEVAAIFQQASEVLHPPQRQLPPAEGLTLAELQDIGREVGIAPELVAHAAASLTMVGSPTTRKFLGLPIKIGRTVELDRKLTDAEWERLVVDLRETFDARGATKSDGSFRQWTNGNLQVLLEPTAKGQRIRMSTVKGSSQAWLAGGIITAVLATFLSVVAVAAGKAEVHPAMVIDIAILSLGQIALAAIGLPGWARRRQKQMEEVAGRIAAASDSAPPTSRS